MPHNNAHHHDWTEERIEQLKKLWGEGFSASECATRLGGITRNSVIGKIHRLGLSGKYRLTRESAPRPRRMTATLKVKRMRKENAAAQLLETTEQQVSRPEMPQMRPNKRPLLLHDLQPHHCRWPDGDRAPYSFCGAPKAFGSSYCEEHKRRSTSGAKLQPVHFKLPSLGGVKAA